MIENQRTEVKERKYCIYFFFQVPKTNLREIDQFGCKSVISYDKTRCHS